MQPILTEQEIEMVLYQVQHPEIRFSLVELGMFAGAEIEGENATVLIALPTLEVPEAIREYIRKTVIQAIGQLEPAARCSVRFVNMTEEPRQRFLALAREGWIDQ